MADKMTGKKPKKVRDVMPVAAADPKGIEGSIAKKEGAQRKKK
jgi:hypothetical protein